MFKKIHSLEPDKVTQYYSNKSGASRKKKATISRINGNLLNDAILYQKLATTKNLHLIKSQMSTLNGNEEKVLSLLYESHLKGSGVRAFIFNQSLVCVGCQKNYATNRSTLDHFLPSSIFPNFYVLPWNLVPTCGDCNRKKNDVEPKKKIENLPHPYFNPITFKKNWLKVVIHEEKPLKFSLDFDNSLASIEKNMVYNHLKAYDLEDVFESHISTAFDEHDDDFQEIFTDSGADNLKDYIKVLMNEEYISPSRLKKYWPINIEYALYLGLSESDWFCNHYYS
ncbi:HNH endonuclease [Vibrio parahaemolyticus]|nr:HNH endonuclease [Vibrio parahaemolyticus]